MPEEDPDDAITRDLIRRSSGLLREALSRADGASMFRPEVLERQIASCARPWNRLTIAFMRPREFLSLAAPIFHEHEIAPEDPRSVFERGKLEDIERGLRDGGLDNLPHLLLAQETGNAGDALRVNGHEGRHRALVAMRLGIERYPVQLSLHGPHLRPDGAMWALMTRAPRALLGEATNARSRLAFPALALTPERLGLDPGWCAAVGGAFSAMHAAALEVPLASRHPAASAAAAWVERERGDFAWLGRPERWARALEFARSPDSRPVHEPESGDAPGLR